MSFVNYNKDYTYLAISVHVFVVEGVEAVIAFVLELVELSFATCCKQNKNILNTAILNFICEKLRVK